MYKIEGSLPTPTSSVEELTDFIECESIRSGSISISDAVKPILIAGDEIEIDGIEDEDDRFINKLESVVREIERRARISNNRYPFELENRGYTIKAVNDNYNYWVYSYLLLSTRLNMLNRKTLENIDGTQILENYQQKLQNHILEIVQNHWFSERLRRGLFLLRLAICVYAWAKDINTITRII